MELSIKKVLMDRDGYSEEDAEADLKFARELIRNGEASPYELLEGYGLDPDYIFDLI